jgi:hypothetical protein
LSDLADSCEYLTIEKLCAAVSESEKAKANRQTRCQNEEKLSCCYLCLSRRECSVSCKFLGKTGSNSLSVEAEKAETEDISNKKTEILTENAPMFCPSCNVAMSQTRTRFRIDGWIGHRPRMSSEGLGDELMAVVVYLCPHCSRIELKSPS